MSFWVSPFLASLTRVGNLLIKGTNNKYDKFD